MCHLHRALTFAPVGIVSDVVALEKDVGCRRGEALSVDSTPELPGVQPKPTLHCCFRSRGLYSNNNNEQT